MKLHQLVACSLALLLGACAQDEGPAVPVCKSIELPDKFPGCPKFAAYPTVTLNTNTMTVTPPWACAKRGDTIKIHIVPVAGNPGAVVIAPKENMPAHQWLAGTNKAYHPISIDVPGDIDPGDYDYKVDMPGTGKCIDPRFRVE